MIILPFIGPMNIWHVICIYIVELTEDWMLQRDESEPRPSLPKTGFRLSQPGQQPGQTQGTKELLSWKTQCETHTPRSYERKSTRIIATCKLTSDQSADFRPCRKSSADPLEDQDAWGTSKNDHAYMGVRSCADHQRCRCAVTKVRH